MSWRPERTRVPASLRRTVLVRDEFCYICRVARPTEVDHVIPDFEGGATDERNCRGICYDCHRVKSRAEADRARRRIKQAAKNPPWKHPGLIE